ncbi:hypothetical protein BX666DRAFT_2033861 [Dichotomocladium elegans]|nr:hypothetical protein BX666DRAFT_2033861 [Dichotomocladium elegans]
MGKITTNPIKKTKPTPGPSATSDHSPATPQMSATAPLNQTPDLEDPNIFGIANPIGVSTTIPLPLDAPIYIVELFQLVTAQTSRLAHLETLAAANTALTKENEALKKRIQELEQRLIKTPSSTMDDSPMTDALPREPGDFTFTVPTQSSPKTDSTSLFRTGQGSTASKYATCSPAPSPADTSSATKQQSPYQAAAYKGLRNPTAQRKITSAARKTAARSFQPISDNQGFQYLYLPCRLKEKISIVRDKLAKLHIATSRILDIQFPTKTIVGLLVHNDYVPTIRNRLAKAKISTIDEFDPYLGLSCATLSSSPSLKLTKTQKLLNSTPNAAYEPSITSNKGQAPLLAPSQITNADAPQPSDFATEDMEMTIPITNDPTNAPLTPSGVDTRPLGNNITLMASQYKAMVFEDNKALHY